MNPTIVCLCGSTKFIDAYREAYRRETLDGNIVLSVGVAIHQGDIPIDSRESVKQMLDELHLRKIDIADEILVLNVGGYIGDSTRREIAYAQMLGRVIRYLEPIAVTPL